MVSSVAAGDWWVAVIVDGCVAGQVWFGDLVGCCHWMCCMLWGGLWLVAVVADLIVLGWNRVVVEYASTTAPPSILKLRAHKATAKPPDHTPPQQQPNTEEDHHDTASSSHEVPRSYYPPPTQQQKPTTETNSSSSSGPNAPATSAARDQHDPPPAFVDKRRLRENQPDRLPQPQPTQPRQTPSPALAAQLHDGRNVGHAPSPTPSGNSPAPEQHDDINRDDATSLMQHTSAVLPTLTQPTDTEQAGTGALRTDNHTPPPHANPPTSAANHPR